MPAKVSFFDMEVSVTPPTGYLQPVPLTLGSNRQSNDIRFLFASGSEAAANNVTEAIQMNPDPPTGFTGGYTLNPGFETRGVYYRTLLATDSDTSVAFIKPVNWRDYVFGLVTARGVDPATAPIAGDLTGLMTHSVGASTATIASVTVPAAGTMIFCLWCVADPEGIWPSWAGSIGTPTGWTSLVATDKSGATYYAYDTNPSIAIIGKSFSTSGTTGSVSIPFESGSHAFGGMYLFLVPAPDVSATLGAA